MAYMSVALQKNLLRYTDEELQNFTMPEVLKI